MVGWLPPLLRCAVCMGHLDHDTNTMHCNTCGRHVPVDHDVPVFVDRIPPSHTGSHPPINERNPTIKALRRGIGEELSRLDLREQTVLDICSGGCFPAAYIASREHCRVVAFDRSYEALVEYGQQFIDYFDPPRECIARVCGDALKPPFAEGVFDAVIGTGWLHHFDSVFNLLEGVARLVVPGGIVAGVNESVQPYFSPCRAITSVEDRPKTYREWKRAIPLGLFTVEEFRVGLGIRRQRLNWFWQRPVWVGSPIVETLNAALVGSGITIVLRRRS
jgi:SAM-dependent methyltransferase